MRCPSAPDASRRLQPLSASPTPDCTRPSAPNADLLRSRRAAFGPLDCRSGIAVVCFGGSLRAAIGAGVLRRLRARRAALGGGSLAVSCFANPKGCSTVALAIRATAFLGLRAGSRSMGASAFTHRAFGKAAHNPSLNRTLHGKTAWPGQRFGLILRRPGQAASPLRAG